MVVRRAAQEPNHHRLYVALLEAMGDRELARLLARFCFAAFCCFFAAGAGARARSRAPLAPPPASPQPMKPH